MNETFKRERCQKQIARQIILEVVPTEFREKVPIWQFFAKSNKEKN